MSKELKFGIDDDRMRVDDEDFFELFEAETFNLLVRYSVSSEKLLFNAFYDYLCAIDLGNGVDYFKRVLSEYFDMIDDVDFLSTDHKRVAKSVIDNYLKKISTDRTVYYSGIARSEFLFLSALFDDFPSNYLLLEMMLDTYIIEEVLIEDKLHMLSILQGLCEARRELNLDSERELLAEFDVKLKIAFTSIYTYENVKKTTPVVFN